MPRKKGPEKTVQIRVYERIGRMLEIISVAEKLTSNEIVTPILEKAIRARYVEALAKLQEEEKHLGGEMPAPSGRRFEVNGHRRG